jgi:uncharacterized PurR-regulated membrane protein YhhQ (DUF165 family)
MIDASLCVPSLAVRVYANMSARWLVLPGLVVTVACIAMLSFAIARPSASAYAALVVACLVLIALLARARRLA